MLEQGLRCGTSRISPFLSTARFSTTVNSWAQILVVIFERIKAEIDAKEDLLAKIANSDKDAGGVDRAFDSLQESIANSDKNASGEPRAFESLQGSSDDPPPSYLTASVETLYEYYAKEYAREILNMKDAYGKENTVAHFRRLHSMQKPNLVRVLD